MLFVDVLVVKFLFAQLTADLVGPPMHLTDVDFQCVLVRVQLATLGTPVALPLRSMHFALVLVKPLLSHETLAAGLAAVVGKPDT